MERLGGIGERIAMELEELTRRETRCVTVGHLQRGGSPTAYDRNLGIMLGAAAVRAVIDGERNVTFSLEPSHVRLVPLAKAATGVRTVPLDDELVRTARAIGISFGDSAA